MLHRREFAAAGLSTLALAAMQSTGQAAEQEGVSEKCAEACADCQLECDACAQHSPACWPTERRTTWRLCVLARIADVCSAAARIVARSGVYAKTICLACAEACAECGSACEKHAHDKVMAECAKECRECEKACRAMLA